MNHSESLEANVSDRLEVFKRMSSEERGAYAYILRKFTSKYNRDADCGEIIPIVEKAIEDKKVDEQQGLALISVLGEAKGMMTAYELEQALETIL